MKSLSTMARRALALAVFVASWTIMAGCGNPSSPESSPAYEDYLYMSDTTNGRIYYYDPGSGKASATPLLTVEGGAGPVAFFDGLGYIPVGNNWSANAPGIYRFDPASPVPAATLLTSGSLSAQYIAFSDSGTAYFTVAGTSDASKDGLYRFDTAVSQPTIDGPIAGTGNTYLQGVIAGEDGFIYAARQSYYGAETPVHEVLKVSPTGASVVATFATSQAGTTALCHGSFGGNEGIFVGNTGGSVDFIPTSGSEQDIVKVADVGAYRVLALSGTKVIAAGWSNSYALDLSAATPAATELLDGGASFGVVDLAMKDGVAYIASNVYNSSNRLYRLGPSEDDDPCEALTVMSAADNIAGLGFYRD